MIETQLGWYSEKLNLLVSKDYESYTFGFTQVGYQKFVYPVVEEELRKDGWRFPTFKEIKEITFDNLFSDSRANVRQFYAIKGHSNPKSKFFIIHTRRISIGFEEKVVFLDPLVDQTYVKVLGVRTISEKEKHVIQFLPVL